jgi:hypothetical protein
MLFIELIPTTRKMQQTPVKLYLEKFLCIVEMKILLTAPQLALVPNLISVLNSPRGGTKLRLGNL